MTRSVRRRRVLKAIGGTGIAVGLAGCSGGGGGTNRTLKQGILMPTSGDLGELGKPIRDAAILPFKTASGDTDFELDYQESDTQTDPNAGQTAANSLVDAGYPAVTGAASSEVTLQVAREVFIPNDVVGCSPASTSPAISDLEDKNLIWRTPPTDALQGKVLAQVASERENASTAATMHVDNSYGQLLSKSFASAFKDGGGTVQTQIAFQKEQNSYSSPLSNALSGDPDVLVVIGYPASGNQLFRDYYSNYERSTSILVTDGLRSGDLPSNVGNPMSNVRGTAPLAAGPGKKYFTNQFKNEYGSDPGVFTSQAFDATAVCLLANAAAGTNAGSKIAENMQAVANPGGEEVTPETLASGLKKASEGTEIQYKGASSAVGFDENGDLKAATYELFGFQEGGGVETVEEIKFSA